MLFHEMCITIYTESMAMALITKYNILIKLTQLAKATKKIGYA